MIVATSTGKFDFLALALLAIGTTQSIIAVWRGKHFNQSPLLPTNLPLRVFFWPSSCGRSTQRPAANCSLGELDLALMATVEQQVIQAAQAANHAAATLGADPDDQTRPSVADLAGLIKSVSPSGEEIARHSSAPTLGGLVRAILPHKDGP